MSDDDWLDELLLADDVSARGWKRTAIGAPNHEVSRHMPRTGQFNCKVPIEQWRVIRKHIRGQRVTMGMWMRHALAAKYISEGGDPTAIPDVIRGRRE